MRAEEQEKGAPARSALPRRNGVPKSASPRGHLFIAPPGCRAMSRRHRRPGPSQEEAPDPKPAGPPGPLVVVEDGVRLSESSLWELQRAFFARQDPTEWSAGRVPSYVTSNAAMARAAAQVVMGFLDDCREGRLGAVGPRVDVLELGAGSGRFAHGVLRELERRLAAAPEGTPRVRYVLTDLDRAPLDALRANPRLARFEKAGLLGFAALDAEADAPGPVRLLGSGEVLSDGPLVVLANYVFDGIRTDAFEVREGVLLESRLRLSCPEGLDPRDPASLPRFVTAFEPERATETPYGDPEWDALLRRYAARLSDGHFLFPIATLRLLRRLRTLAGGRLLVLASDRGHVHEAALLGLEAPHLARHGSFSLDVNFDALARHALATGGTALLPAHHPSHLATVGLLWGAQGPTRAAQAYADAFEHAGPEDLYLLKKTMERQTERLDVERALAWLRLAAFDPDVFLRCAPTLLAGLDAAPPTLRLDVLDAARRVHEALFPTGGRDDVAFVLGELFQALDALPEAESLFQESARLHGRTAQTLHRLALCASALHRLPEALALVEEALQAEPDFEAARAMRIALQAELRRRPARG